jgi:HTH-type transcriptional regulator / antitoxin HipB
MFLFYRQYAIKKKSPITDVLAVSPIDDKPTMTKSFPVLAIGQLTAHIRAFRKARNMTQADLGRLLGVKQSRIADIENDPGSVSVAQMHKLLAALGARLVLQDSGSGWSHKSDDAVASEAALLQPSAPAASTPDRRTGQYLPAVGPSSKARVGKKRGGTW